jgi:hypothetical protein
VEVGAVSELAEGELWGGHVARRAAPRAAAKWVDVG